MRMKGEDTERRESPQYEKDEKETGSRRAREACLPVGFAGPRLEDYEASIGEKDTWEPAILEDGYKARLVCRRHFD